MVQTSVGHRIYFVKILLQHLTHLIGRVVHIQPDQIFLVRHDGVNLQVAHQKHALHDVLLHRLHLAALGSFLNDGLDFFLGHFALRGFDTQHVEHHRRALGKQPHKRRGYQ